MFNFQPIKSPLARRLIFYTILFSTFITLFITILQLYRDYDADIKLIYYELEQIEQVHINSISAALWTSNRKLLKTNIDGIIKIRDMQYVEIKDDNESWVKTGNKSEKNTIKRSYPINYTYRNKNINIGMLTAVVSLDGVYQRLYDKLWVVLISNAIKTSFVAIFIYFLFYFLITRHLEKISIFSRTQNLLLSDDILTLDRNNRKTDEFDTLVNAINSMRTNLRQQIKDALKQRLHLSQTLNSIGDAVITTDISGNITRMNPVAERLTGWQSNEAYGRSVKEVFITCNTTTQQLIKSPIDKVIAKGKTIYQRNHTALITRDGTQIQISDSAAPIKNGDVITGMVLVFNDITEQYKLRLAIKASEQKYQTLTTIAPVGIFYTDPKGKCLYVNEKWSEITGIKAENAIGDGWTKGLHLDDRENIFSEWHKLATDNIPFKCEYRFQTTNNVRWVLGQAQANKDSNGNVIGYVGTITDITERKNAEAAVQVSERQLAEAQRMSHIGNWELDLTNDVLQWSDEVYRIFEINSDKFSASYEAFINAIHPDDREKINSVYSESVINKKPYVITHRLLMPDGRIKYAEERCQTFFDKQGTPLRSSGTIQDITQQVQMEEILRRSQKMDALGKLTGGIAHDYNNMLGVILGYADLLKLNLDSQSKLAEYANEIHRAGERGRKLTQKILSFARQKQVDCKIISINTLLEDEINILKKTLTARIKLQYDLAENLWPISIDEYELEDTILNICINAMHAIEGTGLLTIKTNNENIEFENARLLKLEPGDYVSLSFTDTGQGMSSDVKQKIFDPFYTTKGQQGTGLGLSQVYGFMQRSKGAINVYSEPGQGSRFVLHFQRADQAINKEQTKRATKTKEQQTNATLLVVDDEKALLKLTQTILSSSGYNVLIANSGKHAIEVLKKETVDLMISDVIMPNMDGYQLAAYVQQHFPQVKIQMVSGFADNQHHIETVQELEKNILYKPYRSEALLTQVKNLLYKSSQQDNNKNA